MRQECVFHFLKNVDGVLSAYGWKIIKKLVEAIAFFKIIKQGLHRHSGTIIHTSYDGFIVFIRSLIPARAISKRLVQVIYIP